MALPIGNGESSNSEKQNIFIKNETLINNSVWSYPPPPTFKGSWKEDAVNWMKEFDLHIATSFSSMPSNVIPRYMGNRDIVHVDRIKKYHPSKQPISNGIIKTNIPFVKLYPELNRSSVNT
ncbi:hypothetical protein BB561_002706 [Smittium simulii]|uniref:Uncharacterized protein n=1 Tax=Smittium simulii TaxID=133385 RepID=A0A2T9YPF0_9FUNG|nr:hypothetical protein BB561_002706 [Smittium simulii]